MSKTSTTCQYHQQQKEGLCCPRFDNAMSCSTYNLHPFLVLSHITQDTNFQLRPEVLQGQAGSRCHGQADAAFDASAGCQTRCTHLLQQQIYPSITGSLLYYHHQQQLQIPVKTIPYSKSQAAPQVKHRKVAWLAALQRCQ